jgi:hypothetical protein
MLDALRALDCDEDISFRVSFAGVGVGCGGGFVDCGGSPPPIRVGGRSREEPEGGIEEEEEEEWSKDCVEFKK